MQAAGAALLLNEPLAPSGSRALGHTDASLLAQVCSEGACGAATPLGAVEVPLGALLDFHCPPAERAAAATPPHRTGVAAADGQLGTPLDLWLPLQGAPFQGKLRLRMWLRLYTLTPSVEVLVTAETAPRARVDTFAADLRRMSASGK